MVLRKVQGPLERVERANRALQGHIDFETNAEQGVLVELLRITAESLVDNEGVDGGSETEFDMFRLLEERPIPSEAPFLRAFVEHRRRLRSLWVLPDLLEFYDRLTGYLSKFAINSTHMMSMQEMRVEETLQKDAVADSANAHYRSWK